jgi:alkanesulfonate monooxygenase SsuD/methylene tetrahydromethanopterin reductase-like flavin-dependent oxidoreductase (luciferase family)
VSGDAPVVPVRVFVRVPHAWCHAGASAIEEVAEAAEELGFDGVSVQDHLLSDPAVTPCGKHHGHDDRTVLEAMAVLNYIAGRTRRIRLLSGVFVLPYRDPVLLAKEAATLDVLSGGRLVFGVGIGAVAGKGPDGRQRLNAHVQIARREFAAMGVHGDRGPLMDEMLDAIIALWDEDAPSFEGRHVRFDALDLYPKPVQRPHPPIWIGGRSEAALGRVARVGDGWFPSQATPELIATGRARIAKLAAEAGRARPVDQGVNLFASVAAREEAAKAVIVDALGRRFSNPTALWAATLAGTPAAVLEQMRAFSAAGVNAFDLKILPLGLAATLSQMRLIAEHILPALRPRPVGATHG